MSKQTAIVICPGRGTYGASELGYLARLHGDKPDFMATMDAAREPGQMAISALDGLRAFDPQTHLPGDNASLLIYACALADFARIDRDKFDIVGVTGNSLGWYMALACAGAVSLADGARIVNTTGGLMHKYATGGQIVYPIVDADWQPDPARAQIVTEMLNDADGEVAISIHLGGMAVFAADDVGLDYLQKTLPKDGVFPLRLPYHGAFHSPAMDAIAQRAQAALPRGLLTPPQLPLIDGRGAIWTPHAANIDAMYDYTFGHQITRTYDFSKAIDVAAKEFAPDVYIVLGPGTTLGAPIAQQLIASGWDGLTGKENFKTRQDVNPIILSMGLPSQRALTVK